MQEMTRAFNDEKVCKNLYGFIGEDENEYLPHGVTENEFLERLNSEEYINKSDETVKQDCESKAFVRLAAKIKKKFPRLPIIIAADGLYVSQNVLQICKEYHCDYIIRYICITKNNAKKIVDAGRNRWKIENQGFNRQKHWQGNIEHACSFDERAQKNHYLMEQIADFIKQLYEYFFLEKNGIKRTQKNISSELLASFGWQLMETEDIIVQLHKAVLN